MSKRKDGSRVVNVRDIFHAEVEVSHDGFVLEFYTGPGDAPTKTRLHFEGIWLGLIADLLWKVVKRRRSDLADAERSLRGEP